MRHRALLATSALIALAASTDAGAVSNPEPTVEPEPTAETPTPSVKLYQATALERDPAEGQTAKEITFVVEAVDYKLAWQYARKITSVGDAYFDKTNVWTDKDCKTPLKLAPGSYTVTAVKSLQDRSKKTDVVTADDLLAAFTAKGIKITPTMQATLDSLRGAAPAPAEAEPATGTEG